MNKMGRKKLPETEVLQNYVRAGVTEAEERAFQMHARKRNMRPAELLRIIFREWMEKNP